MEIIRHTSLNNAWLKAAVIGSVWASVEIVAGSFLHNLQIPLSGSILTFFAIFLLSAFSAIWREKGIIWRAGVICALMKSISPSSIILGPMIGILTEAFLFELMLVVAGRNLVGILAGGAIAAVSAIFHKFFTLLILYGTDLVRVLDSLYHYAVKQLKINNITPFDLILLLSFIYLTAGLLAAAMGYRTGRRFSVSETNAEALPELSLSGSNELLKSHDKQRYAALLIALHLLVIILILWLESRQAPLASLALMTGYLLFCFLRYPTTRFRLRKFAIWFQFFVIVATSVLIGDLFTANGTSGEAGWLTGLSMVLRALLLLIGFAAISIELRNPIVRAVLFRRGFSSLYQSLTLAFGVLPNLVNTLSKSGLNILNPVALTSHLLRTSHNLLIFFEQEQEKYAAVIVLTGSVGSGKTTLAARIVNGLIGRGYNVTGFFSLAIDRDSSQMSYRLVTTMENTTIELCSREERPGWTKNGRFYFHPDALSLGMSQLNPDRVREADLVVIDEIGPLELADGGWSPGISAAVLHSRGPQLWIVRKSVVSQVVQKWRTGTVKIFDLDKDDPRQLVQEVERILQKGKI